MRSSKDGNIQIKQRYGDVFASKDGEGLHILALINRCDDSTLHVHTTTR